MVSEAAREAAAKAYESIADCTIPLNFPKRVRAGEKSELVDAFARFEAAIRADQVEWDAKVAEDAAEGSRVLHNLASKDRDRDGVLVHGEAWRSAKEIARAIRQKGSGHEG